MTDFTDEISNNRNLICAAWAVDNLDGSTIIVSSSINSDIIVRYYESSNVRL
jgi:hypothetical protein